MKLFSDLTFWNVIGIIIAIAICAIAVKVVFSFSFDLNKWIDRRDNKLKSRLRSTCPHVVIEEMEDGRLVLQSLFLTVPNTYNFRCSKCGLTTVDKRIAEASIKYYTGRPKEYGSALKKFDRLYKRLH